MSTFLNEVFPEYSIMEKLNKLEKKEEEYQKMFFMMKETIKNLNKKIEDQEKIIEKNQENISSMIEIIAVKNNYVKTDNHGSGSANCHVPLAQGLERELCKSHTIGIDAYIRQLRVAGYGPVHIAGQLEHFMKRVGYNSDQIDIMYKELDLSFCDLIKKDDEEFKYIIYKLIDADPIFEKHFNTLLKDGINSRINFSETIATHDNHRTLVAKFNRVKRTGIKITPGSYVWYTRKNALVKVLEYDIQSDSYTIEYKGRIIDTISKFIDTTKA